MKALIFCAGRGERLRPMTDSIPKPMVNIAGKPCLERIIEHLNSFGITEIMVNLHWLYPRILEYFGDRLMYLYESELLGTAGTIKKALPWMGNNFLVMNGDTPTDLDIGKFVKTHTFYKNLATVSVKPGTNVCDGSMMFSKKIAGFLPDKGMIDDVLGNVGFRLSVRSYEQKDVVRFNIGTYEKLIQAREYYDRNQKA